MLDARCSGSGARLATALVCLFRVQQLPLPCLSCPDSRVQGVAEPYVLLQLQEVFAFSSRLRASVRTSVSVRESARSNVLGLSLSIKSIRLSCVTAVTLPCLLQSTRPRRPRFGAPSVAAAQTASDRPALQAHLSQTGGRRGSSASSAASCAITARSLPRSAQSSERTCSSSLQCSLPHDTHNARPNDPVLVHLNKHEHKLATDDTLDRHMCEAKRVARRRCELESAIHSGRTVVAVPFSSCCRLVLNNNGAELRDLMRTRMPRDVNRRERLHGRRRAQRHDGR